MTGLENILAEIRKSAEEAASQNREEAQKKADAVLEEARAKAKEEAARMDAETEAIVEKITERAKSAAALERRRCILKAKQEVIGELIDAARESLYELREEDYFALLQAMIEKYALPQDGELILSEKDAARLPRGFLKKINASLQEGSLTLSEEKRYLDGGFLLRYGGMEENCTFDALFDAAREQLQDDVNKMLFA